MKARKRLFAGVAVAAALVTGLVNVQTSSAATTTTLFGSNKGATIAEIATNDRQKVELGVAFKSSTAGSISGIRFYKTAINAGTHTATLWNANGDVLARGTFTSETESGWQTVTFANPVAIKASTKYVASYLAPQGGYSITQGFFSRGYSSAPLSTGRNAGVYNYGGGFPTSSWRASNYWVDVVFTSGSATTQTTVTAPQDSSSETPTTSTTQAPTTTSTTRVPTTTTQAPTPTTQAPATTVPVTLPPSGSCDVNATTSNFAAQVSATPAGKVLCLAAGNYGSWSGTNKAITVKAQPGAAVSLSFNFGTSSGNFTLDGVTVTSGSIIGNSTAPKNITVRNSTFTGALVIDGVANANIVLDRNTHNNINNNSSCTATPARIHLAYGSDTPSGVTIQNSLMDGGNTDGVQTGVGVTILNNEIRNIHEKSSSDCAHTDVIQLIGAKGSVVRGNYIHHSASGIVAYDGVESATIENNVLDMVNGRYGIELYSDNGSIVRNNTLKFGTGCGYGGCGQIVLDRKSADPAGKGTIIENNVASSISLVNGSTAAVNRNNLLRSGGSGSNLSGTPTYVGGESPTTLNGFLLTATSAGKGDGVNGTDIGIFGI
jgi:hypothetical protein